jgi:hypothetical protein
MKAENVPAHLILHEALRSFDIAPSPTADGVLIAKADGETHMRHARTMVVAEGDHLHAEGTEERQMVRVMEKVAEAEVDAAGGKKTVVKMRHECSEECAKNHDLEKHEIHIQAEASGNAKGEDGHIRGEFSLTFDEDGEKSNGKLTFDIVPN